MTTSPIEFEQCPPPENIGPYRLERELGQGATSLVFLAVNRENGRRVALKLHRSSAAGEADRLRFQREVQMIRHLRHRHIVEVYDFGVLNGRPYFVMELVEGPDLRSYAAEQWSCRPGVSLEPEHLEELLSFTRQIVEALGCLHRQHLIHCDLKPENVLVAAEGQIKLTDFGLTHDRVGRSRPSRAGAVSGTIAYMAPEQILQAQQLDGRTDFYGLGVLLYELITGRRPFREEGLQDAVYQRLSTTPQPPRELAPWIEPGLDALLQSLLARDPASRPPSSEVLLQKLDRLAAGEKAAQTPESQIVENLLAPAQIGRPEWEDWLMETMGRCREEGARVVLFSGRSGMGKSRLLEASSSWARTRALPQCLIRCRPEQRTPFSAGASLVELAARWLEVEAVEDQTAWAPAALLVPSLADRFSVAGSPNPARALSAALELVKQGLGGRPALVLIDDGHWVDELSCQFFELLLGSGDLVPALILLTHRPEALKPEHPLSRLAGERVERRELASWNEQNLALLLGATLGVAAEQISKPLVDQVIAAAQGSPMLALWELERLVETRRVVRVRGSVLLQGPAEKEPPASSPSPHRRTGGSLFAGLNRFERQLLEAAATLGRALPTQLLIHLTGEEQETLLDALNRLLARRILVSVPLGEDGFEFRSESFRQDVLRELPPAQRAEWSRRLALAIQKCSRSVEIGLETLGDLYARGGEVGCAVECYHQATERALRLSANQDVIRITAAALEALESSGGLGEELRQRKVNFLTRRTEAFHRLGEFERALRSGKKALAAAGEAGVTRLRLAAENSLMILYGELGQMSRALHHTRAALQLARELGLTELEGRLLINLGWLQVKCRFRSKARQALHEAGELARGHGLSMLEITALLNLAELDLETAEADDSVLLRAQELAEAGGMELQASRALHLRARHARFRGDLNQAEEQCRQALEESRRLSDRSWAVLSVLELAELEWERGRPLRAQGWLRELEGPEVEQPILLLRRRRLEGSLELGEGRMAAAISTLEKLRLTAESRDPLEGLRCLKALATAWQAVGRMEQAQVLLERVEHKAKEQGLAALLPALWTARARLHREEGLDGRVLGQKLEEWISESRDRRAMFWAWRLQMLVWHCRGEWRENRWEEGRRLFERENARADELESLLLRSETCLEWGAPAEAVALLPLRARELARSAGPWAKLRLAAVLANSGPASNRAEAAAEGRELLKHLASQVPEPDQDAFLQRPLVQRFSESFKTAEAQS